VSDTVSKAIQRTRKESEWYFLSPNKTNDGEVSEGGTEKDAEDIKNKKV